MVVVFVASLTGCSDNLAPYTSPETPTIGNDRATVTGHILDTSGAPVASEQQRPKSSYNTEHG